MNIVIVNSDTPIYAQIAEQIRKAIMNGELSPGQNLPSIRQLAKDLQVSVITTKRAYEELEKSGFIESMVGKGSFVSGNNRGMIREHQLKQLEQKMLEVVHESKALGIPLQELIETWTYMYEEEHE